MNLSIDSGGGSLNGPGYKNAEFDKEQMRSYPQELVILGDAELNAFFHLLGINSKIVGLILSSYLITQASGDVSPRVLVL